jgi:hypothetical protein
MRRRRGVATADHALDQPHSSNRAGDPTPGCRSRATTWPDSPRSTLRPLIVARHDPTCTSAAPHWPLDLSAGLTWGLTRGPGRHRLGLTSTSSRVTSHCPESVFHQLPMLSLRCSELTVKPRFVLRKRRSLYPLYCANLYGSSYRTILS